MTDRLAEPIAITVDAVRAFDELGIAYAVGGSLASSLHGRPRATDDVDIIAAVRSEHARASAEDIVLQKLKWYRLGGETSDRQWRDVVGVLDVTGPRIDLAHLLRWAPVLHVEDLLDRALSETAAAR